MVHGKQAAVSPQSGDSRYQADTTVDEEITARNDDPVGKR